MIFLYSTTIFNIFSKIYNINWIWIQIGPKSWIRIQIPCIWIHNIGVEPDFLYYNSVQS